MRLDLVRKGRNELRDKFHNKFSYVTKMFNAATILN